MHVYIPARRRYAGQPTQRLTDQHTWRLTSVDCLRPMAAAAAATADGGGGGDDGDDDDDDDDSDKE